MTDSCYIPQGVIGMGIPLGLQCEIPMQIQRVSSIQRFDHARKLLAEFCPNDIFKTPPE